MTMVITEFMLMVEGFCPFAFCFSGNFLTYFTMKNIKIQIISVLFICIRTNLNIHLYEDVLF